MNASLEAATIVEEVSGLLAKAQDRYGKALELLRLTQLVAQLVASAEAVGRDLRSAAWSAEHHQPSTKKRRALLLTAVWQHLDWGGSIICSRRSGT